MAPLKKYLNRYDENGFINTQHEKVEKYFLIAISILALITLAALIVWVFVEHNGASSHL